MKKWLFLLAIVIFAGLYFYFGVGWQKLTMILAGIGAPLKLLANMFGESEASIKARFAKDRKKEAKYQNDLENEIKKQVTIATSTQTQISNSQTKVDDLEKQRVEMNKKIDSMSPDDLVALSKNFFGS